MTSEHEKSEDVSLAEDLDTETTEQEVNTDEEPSEESVDSVSYAEMENRLLRLQADFENYRKRMARERSEISRTANENILSELLTVIDHLDMALDAAVAYNADKAFMDGFQLVSDQMRNSLSKFGLSGIETDGKEFDPNLHEAITYQPSEDIAEGHIAVCTRKGFMLGDKLLRAAQVVVSSGPAGE